MNDEELWKLIEEVEKEPLHKAPDYLKELTLRKIQTKPEPASKDRTKQYLYYKIRVFAAMAASLMVLFFLPQPKQPERAEQTSVMQTVHEKSNELCAFLNNFSNDLIEGGFLR